MNIKPGEIKHTGTFALPSVAVIVLFDFSRLTITHTYHATIAAPNQPISKLHNKFNQRAVDKREYLMIIRDSFC